MLKRYYSLDEAIQFLGSELKQPFSDRDIVDLVKRGRLDLCFFRTLTFSVFELVGLNFYEKVKRWPILFIEAYFRVGSLDVLDSLEIPTTVRHPEVFDELTKPFFTDNRQGELIKNATSSHMTGFMNWMPCQAVEIELGYVEHEPIAVSVNRHQYVLPAEQLLQLVASHNGNILQKGDADQSLGTRERGTLLKLVIGMAVKGYGHDPAAAKSTAPKEITDDLAGLGMSVTDDTVRKYLKQAADTVLPSKPHQS